MRICRGLAAVEPPGRTEGVLFATWRLAAGVVPAWAASKHPRSSTPGESADKRHFSVQSRLPEGRSRRATRLRKTAKIPDQMPSRSSRSSRSCPGLTAAHPPTAQLTHTNGRLFYLFISVYLLGYWLSAGEGGGGLWPPKPTAMTAMTAMAPDLQKQ